MKKQNETRYTEVLNSILHGHKYGFETCKLIHKALSFEDEIPDSFWFDENEGLVNILGHSYISKSHIENIRDELIVCIAQRLENQKKTEYGDKISTDHYSRYFHALALLGVPKNTPLVPAMGRNLLYNAAYSLWALDDGSDEAWEHINSTMWYISEAINNNGAPSRIRVGKRHCFE